MIKIVTDSTCDLPGDEIRSMGVSVAPLTIQFGDESYRDGFDMSSAEFYRRLEASEKMPTTSQATPEQFKEIYKEAIKAGDEVVVITISSELSATYASALTAAKATDESKVHVVDSRLATAPMGTLVREAVKMRDEGKMTAAQIAEELCRLRDKTQIFFVIDTLKYLQKGGRIGRAQAMIGGVLGITPVLTLRDGIVTPAGKVRSEKRGIEFLIDCLNKKPADPAYGIVIFHGDVTEKRERLFTALSPLIEGVPVLRETIGGVIGTHTGPGVIGISYIEK